MLEELRQIIIKNDKSILDLKFGCQLFIQNFVTSITLIENRDGWCDVDGQIGDMIYVGWTGNGTQCFAKKHIKEIIGRPIRLSDVLRVIKFKKVQPKIMFKPDGLNENGEFVEWCFRFERWIFKATWNLEKDNINDQSPETIEFLHKILNNKEQQTAPLK